MLLRRKRRVFWLRQVRLGISQLTQERIPGWKGFACIGALMTVIVSFLGIAVATVTIYKSAV